MSKDTRIQRRATPEQKARWLAFCEEKGVSESEMLGLLIDKVTGGRTGFVMPAPKEPRTEKITIRLTPSDMTAAGERAKTEGFPSRTKWLTRLALATLDSDPVLNDVEINTLRESNRELAAIGRNLNQIARVLNTDFRESDRVTRAAIGRLTEQIEEHREKVSALLNRSLNRWEHNG